MSLLTAPLMILRGSAYSALSIAIGTPVSVPFVERMPMLADRFVLFSWLPARSNGYILWFRVKQFLQRMAGFSSLHDGVCFQARQLRKKCSLIFNAIYRYLSSVSPIKRLLSPARPFAILRRIRAVVIDAFEGESFRTISHILSKCWKAFKPSFADHYSATAIIRIGCISWIQASLLHLKPDFIERIPTHSVQKVFSHKPMISESIKGVKE